MQREQARLTALVETNRFWIGERLYPKYRDYAARQRRLHRAYRDVRLGLVKAARITISRDEANTPKNRAKMKAAYDRGMRVVGREGENSRSLAPMCSARWSGCRSRTARRLGPELPPRTRWAYDDEGARPVGVRTPGVLGVLLCGGETIAVRALQLPLGHGRVGDELAEFGRDHLKPLAQLGWPLLQCDEDSIGLRVRRRNHAGGRSHRTLEALGDVDSVRSARAWRRRASSEASFWVSG